eukprot:COSAG02_NODE_104_length_36421_cov_132.465420_5_plen_150_part_00
MGAVGRVVPQVGAVGRVVSPGERCRQSGPPRWALQAGARLTTASNAASAAGSSASGSTTVAFFFFFFGEERPPPLPLPFFFFGEDRPAFGEPPLPLFFLGMATASTTTTVSQAAQNSTLRGVKITVISIVACKKKQRLEAVRGVRCFSQ